jgi:hypothetical protein
LIKVTEEFPVKSTYIILLRQPDQRALALSIEEAAYGMPLSPLTFSNVAYDPIFDEKSEETSRLQGYVRLGWKGSVKCSVVDSTKWSSAMHKVIKNHPRLFAEIPFLPDTNEFPTKIKLEDQFTDGLHIRTIRGIKLPQGFLYYTFEGDIKDLTHDTTQYETDSLSVGRVYISGVFRVPRDYYSEPNHIVSQAILGGGKHFPRMRFFGTRMHLEAGLTTDHWPVWAPPLEITVVTSYSFAEALEAQQRFYQEMADLHYGTRGYPPEYRAGNCPSLALIGGNSGWRSQLHDFIQSIIEAGKKPVPWPPSRKIADADVFFIRDYYAPGVHATFGTSDELTENVCFPSLLEILAQFNLGYGPRNV